MTTDSPPTARTAVPTTTGRFHVVDDGVPVLPAEQFKAAFRNHAAGVAVITADAGDGPVALTATSVFSVSAEPPLLVFSLSASSSSTPTLTRASTVVVHLLSADQLDLAVLAATSGIDRFADTSIWSRLETGEPYFTAAPVWIRGSRRRPHGGRRVDGARRRGARGQDAGAGEPGGGCRELASAGLPQPHLAHARRGVEDRLTARDREHRGRGRSFMPGRGCRRTVPCARATDRDRPSTSQPATASTKGVAPHTYTIAPADGGRVRSSTASWSSRPTVPSNPSGAGARVRPVHVEPRIGCLPPIQLGAEQRELGRPDGVQQPERVRGSRHPSACGSWRSAARCPTRRRSAAPEHPTRCPRRTSRPRDRATRRACRVRPRRRDRGDTSPSSSRSTVIAISRVVAEVAIE